ncbi:MAG: transposase [Candidatus Jettenia caeni]|nr:MAG: transposase [Candidatus Jettenia caeni]
MSKTFYDSETKRARDLSSGSFRISVEFEYRRVFCKKCNAVKVETLSWLASNIRYTKRYERYIGRLCRELTIKRVVELERLSWYQVRQIEINYMHELVGRLGKITRPRAVGIDEISIRKGHTYMICVSDLDKGRPIWVGGEGRREEDLDLFYTMLSDSQKKNISVVVMDMWKPFRKSTLKYIPHVERIIR